MSEKEPPPYKIIGNLLKSGEVVPFLGAGVNFGMRQPPNAQWAMKTANFLPSGADLSNYLIEQCEFPEKDETDLAKVSSYYCEVIDRPALSEGLTPDELVLLLNEYLGAMTDVLFKNLGTLDKYIGDAIMAFCG